MLTVVLSVLAAANTALTVPVIHQQQPQKPEAREAHEAQESEGIGPADPGTQVTDYLAAAPDSLRLTPAQRARITKVREWLRSANTPLRDSIRAATGGRSFRAMTPAERRTTAPRLQPLMARMRANGQTALDSVDAVLTPEQQAKLRTLRAEYREHHGRGPAAPPPARGRRS